MKPKFLYSIDVKLLSKFFKKFYLFIYLFIFGFFLGPYPWHMEAPRLGVELEV